MSGKTIFIILCSVLLTLILVNNTDDMTFWLFGETKIPKLAVLGSLFFIGWLLGYLMGKSGGKNDPTQQYTELNDEVDGLSETDREYIR